MRGHPDAGQRQSRQPALAEAEVLRGFGGVLRQVRRDPFRRQLPAGAGPDDLDVDLLPKAQKATAILAGVSGRGEWLPWRRDWSKTPNMWKVYVAYSVLFGLIGVVYLAGGKRIGVVWLVLAIAWALITGYVRRKSRPHPQVGEDDRQPD